jgi:hypothetical protein
VTIEFSHKLDTEVPRRHVIIAYARAVSSTTGGGVR